jgi:hypothetical protein
VRHIVGSGQGRNSRLQLVRLDAYTKLKRKTSESPVKAITFVLLLPHMHDYFYRSVIE